MTKFFSFPAVRFFYSRHAVLAAFLTVFILYGDKALAQQDTIIDVPAAANEAQAQAEDAPPIPEEFSEEARAAYEGQLKTLRAQMGAEEWEEALKTTDVLMEARPREPQVRFIRSIALTELGRGEEAKNVLLALISDFPELPEPRNNLAAMYAKAGEFTLAQRELEIAIATVPDYSVAHANLADLYLQLALQHYQKAIDTNKEASVRRALTKRADNLRALIAPQEKQQGQNSEPTKENTEASSLPVENAQP